MAGGFLGSMKLLEEVDAKSIWKKKKKNEGGEWMESMCGNYLETTSNFSSKSAFLFSSWSSWAWRDRNQPQINTNDNHRNVNAHCIALHIAHCIFQHQAEPGIKNVNQVFP